MFIDVNNEVLNITKVATISKYEDNYIKYTLINGEIILENFENKELRDTEFNNKKEKVSA